MDVKKYIIILSLFYVVFSVAQQKNIYGVANYEFIKYRHTDTIIKNTKVFFNKSSSIYLVPLKSKIKRGSKKEIKGDMVMSFKNEHLYKELKEFPIYINFKNHFIQRKSIAPHKRRMQGFIIEETTKIKWLITNETKNIDGVHCIKASTTFRGRNYIAWFNPRINFPTGPWKLYGLPGIIVEVYDDSNKFYFGLKKIQFFAEKKNLLPLKENKLFKKINLKSFVLIEKRKEKEFKALFVSKFNLPPDFEIKGADNNREMFLERDYNDLN